MYIYIYVYIYIYIIQSFGCHRNVSIIINQRKKNNFNWFGKKDNFIFENKGLHEYY